MQGYDRSCETGPPALGSKVGIDERGGYVHSDPPGYYVMFLERVPIL